jgi:hypothetical protein
MRAGRLGGANDLIAQRQEGCGREILGADLENPRTPLEIRAGEIRRAPPGACGDVDVDDRVEP